MVAMNARESCACIVRCKNNYFMEHTQMIYQLQGTKSSKSFISHFNPGTEATAGYTVKHACPLLKSQLQDPWNEEEQ